jgi:hypothetical protein
LSAKREYLWAVFDKTPQSPKLIDAALIFYHSEVPVEQAREYIHVLATKIKKEKENHHDKTL